MSGIVIDGIKIAASVKSKIKENVLELQKRGIKPCLATILVGDDVASVTYVKKKHDACFNVGISTLDHRLKDNTSQKDLNKTIEELNLNQNVHGILLQLPLPEHLSSTEALSKMSPDKDVDGLTSHSMGLLAIDEAKLIPCTPLAIMTILEYQDIDLAGKTIVVVNRSNLIGKPLVHLLLKKDATVIVCHSKTKNIEEFTQIADVLITGVGDRTRFEVRPNMIKDNCVVIDVAISRYNGKLVGDVDYKKAISKVSHITPVPGGVGPMTVAMLLQNTIIAAASINNVEIKTNITTKAETTTTTK